MRAEMAARCEAGATIRELAAWSGAHRQTAIRHLVRAGLELRCRGLSVDEAEAVGRLYLEGRTLVEIASCYGVAASTIRTYLLRQGVFLRPAARRRMAAS